jgi:hypothetical protein
MLPCCREVWYPAEQALDRIDALVDEMVSRPRRA